MRLLPDRPLQSIFTRVKAIQSQVVRRYLVASILSVILDFVLFQTLLSKAQTSIPISIIVGRMISMAFNFILLKKWVFESQQSTLQAFPKYFTLVLINLTLTTTFTTSIAKLIPINPIVAKFLGDTITYFLIFLINRFIVFDR